jgi:hypothetical protein
MEGDPVYVRVLYNFDYTTKETKLVSIRQGEKLELLKQTNADWWQVKRDDETKAFYVPATYVREIPPPFINPLIHKISPTQQNVYNKQIKIVPKNEISSQFSPTVEYQNISALNSSPESPRNDIESKLRNELIHGNFNKSKPCDNIKKLADKLQESTRLGNLVNDIKVQQKVSQDNRGVGNSSVVSFEPSTRGETRSYSVVNPTVPKKPPVPCPRLKELSKSLETLAEEIQFTPKQSQISDSSWKNGETSDYHTPSPDHLDNDMFWRKSIQPQEDLAGGSSNVQRSSSLRVTRWPSRKKKQEQKRTALVNKAYSEEDSKDSPKSRSLESLVDSGAEACSSSSYEWDRSGEISEGTTTINKTFPAPLQFRNYTYCSTDDSDQEEQISRLRSSSDTTQPGNNSINSNETSTDSIKNESQVGEQPRPLVSLKRNQKLVSV